MYNETYEDYIRNILGYSMPMSNYNMYSNTPLNEEYQMEYANMYNRNENDVNNYRLETYYPEIYKTVYPMVRKVCMENVKELTQDRIDEMTEEIFNNIQENREETVNASATVKTEKINSKEKQDIQENRGEDRQSGNRNIRDLIKILILRELLGGNRPPIRPPRPNHRPPFRPGFPPNNQGNRPPIRPIQPRNQFENIYEDF